MTSDRLSASWVLVVGTMFVAYYYYKTKPKGGGDAKVDSGASRETLGSASGSILEQLTGLAGRFGLPVTSTAGGGHVKGSLHYQGRAIDVGVRGISEGVISQFEDAARAAGFSVHPELYTGYGDEGYSSGPHIHVSKPFPGGGW